jgi:CDP-glucose 4,6-dehydratase
MGLTFWADKRVLVTGHTGFKGSWLSMWLHRLGADVVGVSLKPPTEPNLFTEGNVAQLVQDNRCDIRNLPRLKELINDISPDVIIHLAAQSLVRESYETPIETFDTNVMGTANVLYSSIHCSSVKSLVAITSDKCYKNNKDNKSFVENDALGGEDPYSASKACSELVVGAMRNLAGPQPFATARAGNVIGGGDWGVDRLIPDLVQAFSKKQSCELRNPDFVRPWQHVLEPLHGYLLLAERVWDTQSSCSGWNFGSDPKNAKTVNWIAEESVRLWGAGASCSYTQEVGVPEAKFLRLDSSKSKNELGWKPIMSVEEAVDWTIEWYRKYYSGASAFELCQEQIELYECNIKNNEM